ncbi:hypothetical protein CL622_08115 [archaeon]|nr:hypothetical protein [archaeon]|tara:strand:+ start:595 stop:984 length:390 start_codon:yes stop_codon:yes gene_type:complete
MESQAPAIDGLTTYQVLSLIGQEEQHNFKRTLEPGRITSKMLNKENLSDEKYCLYEQPKRVFLMKQPLSNGKVILDVTFHTKETQDRECPQTFNLTVYHPDFIDTAQKYLRLHAEQNHMEFHFCFKKYF